MELRRAGLVLVVLSLLLAGTAPLRAEGEMAGDFDYYVLSLSWSPAWCDEEGDARHAPQCSPGARQGFVLHGLWPQWEAGWPEWCRTRERDPSRAETAAMAALLGGAGQAFHQWKKHGRCSGLSAAAYFDTARRAFAAITIPRVFARMTREVKVSAAVIEDAFLEANPGLSADDVTVVCGAGAIREVRICLTRELAPRPCGADTRRDCRLPDARLKGLR